jgi:hypothetical protein
MTVYEESNIRIEKPMTEKERIFKAKMDYKLETMNFKEGAPVPEIE